MPKLDNPRDEQFAQNYVNHPLVKFNKTQAYLSVYPNAAYNSARVTVHQKLAKPSIKNRIIELLENNRVTSDEGCSNKLAELMTNAKDGVQLGAVQTVLKIYGVLSDGQNSLQQNNIAEVMFNEITVNKEK